jgi:hypothetical protein
LGIPLSGESDEPPLQRAAEAHNLEVAGANPAPGTKGKEAGDD